MKASGTYVQIKKCGWREALVPGRNVIEEDDDIITF